MYSFNIRDWKVQTLLARLGVQHQKAMGRGTFSVVYRHPDRFRDTVLKITSCLASYTYLIEAPRFYDFNDSPFFPRVIDDLAQLNEELIESDSPLRVIELERLEKRRHGASMQANMLAHYVMKSWPSQKGLTPPQTTARRHEEKNPKLCSRLKEFAYTLGHFCTDYGYQVDGLANGNTLFRGEQAVFSDPVFDLKEWRRLQCKVPDKEVARWGSRLGLEFNLN